MVSVVISYSSSPLFIASGLTKLIKLYSSQISMWNVAKRGVVSRRHPGTPSQYERGNRPAHITFIFYLVMKGDNEQDPFSVYGYRAEQTRLLSTTRPLESLR